MIQMEGFRNLFGNAGFKNIMNDLLFFAKAKPLLKIRLVTLLFISYLCLSICSHSVQAVDPHSLKTTGLNSAAKWRPVLLRPKDCELKDWEAAFSDPANFSQVGLDHRHTLLGVVCRTAAYNSLQAFYIAPKGSYPLHPIKPIIFKNADLHETNGKPHESDMLIGMPIYLPQYHQLFNLAKGRGMGDCGTLSAWTYHSPDKFVLLQVQARNCGEYISPNPLTWPVIYQAKHNESLNNHFVHYLKLRNKT